MQRLVLKRIFLGAILISSLILSLASFACSRALWVTKSKESKQKETYVGRTMDWPNSLRTTISISPRGALRDGNADENSLTWNSKYGNITARAHGIMTTDGMNEKGLAAHLHWLNETDFGTRDNNIPGVSVTMWAQYFLDNFATVDEAVHFAKHNSTFQVESFKAVAGPIDLQLLLEDASGDSAIIQLIKDLPEAAANKHCEQITSAVDSSHTYLCVYHGHHHTVVTNSPTYDKHLAHVLEHKGFGGTKPLPGSSDSQDRFVRTSHYLAHLPHPDNQSEAVAELLSVMNNIAAPFGASSLEHNAGSHTVWRTVLDLTHRKYYYQSTTPGYMNLMMIPLDKCNFAVGAPEYILDPEKVSDSGDIFHKFKEIPPDVSTSDVASRASKLVMLKNRLKTGLTTLPRD